MKRCEGMKNYYCHSNYYVRIFSGSDGDDDLEMMLEMAKNNIKRFSCISLIEDWDVTTKCLRRLGMFRKLDGQYNIGGQLVVAPKPRTGPTESLLAAFSEEQLEMFTRLNEYDGRFYAWAREYAYALASEPLNLRRI